MSARLRLRSTCLFFIVTGSKALALPNTRTSCASSKLRFRRLFAILNQEKLMALKCDCVIVRRDFDNESAGRRELWLLSPGGSRRSYPLDSVAAERSRAQSSNCNCDGTSVAHMCRVAARVADTTVPGHTQQGWALYGTMFSSAARGRANGFGHKDIN